MAPEGMMNPQITWRGMPIGAALDNLEGRLNIAVANAADAKTSAGSAAAANQSAQYLSQQYERQSKVTDKLVKELIEELKDYKEEFKKLSEHCDELENEVKELKERLEKTPQIDIEEYKKTVEKNGGEWPQQFPQVWRPYEITWEQNPGRTPEIGEWKIKCSADDPVGKTKMLADELFKAAAVPRT